ncbi:MBL fold metallo-hydrolase [Alkalihalobacterium alkalinitrilicum]|uniref:MBL fold metallo-hydrolase n=1 Tax=Alkalihalobacterium alkalinitrilicum TaxID=427920 RepID=UPI000995BDA1|nr:MBL fold metallo-hydrolase [Alkalihalobacterium alkalinitrilicum]
MRITDDVYFVGSGALGMNTTDPFDCNIYLIDGGDELAILDSGSGMGVEKVLSNVENLGYLIDQIKYLILGSSLFTVETIFSFS